MNNDLASENTIVDAIIKRRMSQLQENGIALEVLACAFPLMKISEDDLTVLISCLLDNAIEECIKNMENRYIKLWLFLMKNHLYIELINTSRKRGKISRRFGFINSLKACINVLRINKIIEKSGAYINHHIKGNIHRTELLLSLADTSRCGDS